MAPTPSSRGFHPAQIPALSPNPAEFPHNSRNLKFVSVLFSTLKGAVSKRFLLGVQEVPSSNLGSPTMFSITYARLILISSRTIPQARTVAPSGSEIAGDRARE